MGYAEAGAKTADDAVWSHAGRRPQSRLPFIDNIRWSMILLVLSMHASDTYSPFGNWYYTDRGPLSLGERIFFLSYQSFLQGFFMALLFFVAACFTPASYGRKGAGVFVRDRFKRLMLPTLLYIFVIGPLTEYYVSHTWTGGGGFAHQWLGHVTDGEWLSGSGPMWFCAALFGFSLVYALWQSVHGGRPAKPEPPKLVAIAGFAVAMAVATFALRIYLPEGVSVLNMHPGDFPQYILMFAAGILAARGAWLEKISDRSCVIVSATFLGSAIPIWAGLVAWAATTHADLDTFAGGWHFASAVKSLWEGLVCVGVSFGLLAFYRRYFNAQGPFARILSDNAFAVYLFHPPIIVAVAILLHPVFAPGPFKAFVLTALAAVVAFTLSEFVFRRIPYLRQIL